MMGEKKSFAKAEEKRKQLPCMKILSQHFIRDVKIQLNYHISGADLYTNPTYVSICAPSRPVLPQSQSILQSYIGLFPNSNLQ